MHFQDLDCWKEARKLTSLAFNMVRSNSELRDDVLRPQLLRASVSVMNNIAEGYGRISQKEMMRYLDIAAASCSEVESMTYILEDLKCLPPSTLENFRSQTILTKKLIKGYLRYWRNKSNS